MDINKNKLYRNPEALTRIIDSNAVVIFLSDDYDESLKREVYIFNDTGTIIWELINEENNIDGIVKKICLEYELTPQKATGYIEKFVEKLTEAKLINNFIGEKKKYEKEKNTGSQKRK